MILQCPDGKPVPELQPSDMKLFERMIPLAEQLAFHTRKTDLAKSMDELVMNLELAYGEFRPPPAPPKPEQDD